jgi:branched-chain amino acid transport system permease protein
MSTTANQRVNASTGQRLVSWLGGQWVGLAIVIGLALFPFVFSGITGTPVGEGPSKFWQGQLIAFFIMAVYAMSYDLLMGYTGILSFGQAAFFGGGAYTMALFLKHVAGPFAGRYRIVLFAGLDATELLFFLFALVLVVLVSALLGLLFSAVSARVRGVYFAMITLAIAEAIYILSKATDFVKWTGADEGLHGIPVPVWLNPTQYRLRFYFVALIFTVGMYLIVRRIVESPTGRVFVALRENESRVRTIGYNPATYRTIAFVVSAIVAGLAGALWSLWNVSATPSMTGALTTINALIMTILGGIGTLIGPMLGAGLMQIVGQFFYQWFGPRWPLVFGLIFIALVLFLPYGIVGTWRLKSPTWRQGWQRLLKLVRESSR